MVTSNREGGWRSKGKKDVKILIRKLKEAGNRSFVMNKKVFILEFLVNHTKTHGFKFRL